MGAKVYDTTSQAWKDATPQIYAGGGWSDTVGKVWDSSSQAWVDAWDKKQDEIIYYYESVNDYNNGTRNVCTIPQIITRSNQGGWDIPCILAYISPTNASKYKAVTATYSGKTSGSAYFLLALYRGNASTVETGSTYMIKYDRLQTASGTITLTLTDVTESEYYLYMDFSAAYNGSLTVNSISFSQ